MEYKFSYTITYELCTNLVLIRIYTYIYVIIFLVIFLFSGFATGIYSTNSPEACEYCIKHSLANIVVVDDEKQLAKILQIKSNLSDLKAIIQYEGVPIEKDVLSVRTLQSLSDNSTKESYVI